MCCLNVQASDKESKLLDWSFYDGGARLRLLLPQNGLATLTFVYKLTSEEIHDNDVRYLDQKMVDWSPIIEGIAEECWN